MFPRQFVFYASLCLAAEKVLFEHSSYKNSNPRPYDNCEANDLIKLSACCNDVLADLDDCKAGDLACECCALQMMDPACYSLCPGNPSTNFLSVLFADCAALNDVNACNIPFKRIDGEKPSSYKLKSLNLEMGTAAAVVKTQMVTQNETVPEEIKAKPKLNLIGNFSAVNTTLPASSASISVKFALASIGLGVVTYVMF